MGEPTNRRVAMAREICSPKLASCREFSVMNARNGAPSRARGKAQMVAR
jgi:hypothetical protein